MITQPNAMPALTEAHSPLVIATRGLPASGKTTWAREQLARHPAGTIARCNRDDLRRMTQGTPRYDTESEAVITMIQHDAITILLKTGHSVIVDDTNLDNDHLNTLAMLAVVNGARFQVRDFRHVPLDTCIWRDRQRGADQVGEDVIRDMHARYLRGLS